MNTDRERPRHIRTRLPKTILCSSFVLLCTCNKPERWPPSEPAGVSTVHSAVLGQVDPLPSWKPGHARQAILDLITSITAPGSASLVAEQDRIAVFDNDGTLWQEKPPPEAAFTVARLRSQIVWSPGLSSQEPFRSILADDVDKISRMGPQVVLPAIARTHSGITDELFERAAHTFLVDARHPVFRVPYTDLTYRPMRELLAYLRAHKFTIYVSTAGDQAFVRTFAPATYNVPRERVIGSTFGREPIFENGRMEMQRTSQITSFNDKDEKAVNIDRYIGRRPVVAAGNVRSGGDIAMLTYTRGRVGPSLALVIQHDDPEREFAYDEADGATLAAAHANGFVVVSMRSDWSQVFDAAQPAPLRAAP